MRYIVLVLAFGYFVDLFDMGILGTVRVASLRELEVPEDELLATGAMLFNMQLVGMLLGGLAWGVLGDKKGRTFILFGSIATYALANLLNAAVESVEVYALLRFISGFGLAGELGGAVTLLSEVLGRYQRGIGTTIMVSIGGLGSVFAGLAGDHLYWRTCYLLGGLMGVSLLFARLLIFESPLYQNMLATHAQVKRGSLRLLLLSWPRVKTLLLNIAVGMPIYFMIVILLVFLPELAAELEVEGQVTVGRAAVFHFTGKSVGNLISGFLSQRFASRKRVIQGCLVATTFVLIGFLASSGLSAMRVYLFLFAMGLTVGYWAVYVVTIAEQFGTNLRATVVTSIPSFVRGAAIVLTLTLEMLYRSVGLVWLIGTVGISVMVVAWFAVRRLSESFGKDLNFLEESAPAADARQP